MSVSQFDSYRPPEEPRRRKRRGPGGPGDGPRRGGGQGGGRGAGRRGADGSREMPMVPDAEFTSYYGRPIVKAPPWEKEIAAYLFLGGVAGGSALLALGADLTGRDELRRNARLGALGAAGVGTVALVKDLGRPERFHHMLRTFKITSPMSMGSWLLGYFSTHAGVAAAAEVDRLTGEKLPLGPLRRVLHAVEFPAGLGAGVLGAPLAGYTAMLLGTTAVPTWHEMHRDLPFVFVSSASLAASGLAMVTTSPAQTGPARALAVMGVAGDLVAMKYMTSRMHPVAAEPLHTGAPGRYLRWSERLALAGAAGTLLAGRRRRPLAIASGLALLAASALTRAGVFYAGKNSVKDPKYTVVPQKDRLESRRADGVVDDSITTAG